MYLQDLAEADAPKELVQGVQVGASCMLDRVCIAGAAI